MDRVDCKILARRQSDADIPGPELAKAVGISNMPCWRRVQKLGEEKVIRRRIALLDAAKINAAVTVVVSIREAENILSLREYYSIAAYKSRP